MSAVTRPDLIEAAAKAIVAEYDEYPEDARYEATFAVDAVLPLIVGLIDAEISSHCRDYPLTDQRFRDGLSHARWLVRWLTEGAGR